MLKFHAVHKLRKQTGVCELDKINQHRAWRGGEIMEFYNKEERMRKLKELSEKITKEICEEEVYDVEIDCFLELLRIELGFVYDKKI